MAVDSFHPQYETYVPDWILLRDCFKGERAVKAKRELYLPALQSMVLDGMKINEPGLAAYNAFLTRAVFPDFVKEGVQALLGMLHQKPAVIEVPELLKPLVDKITLSGESCQDLLRAIYCEQLLTGRAGLLADLPTVVAEADKAKVLPYVVLYNAESVVNWDAADSREGFNALNLVVLDESGPIRHNDFQWKEEKRFRVLQLGNLNALEPSGDYLVGTFTDQNAAGLTYSTEKMQAPARLGKKMDEIPFVFVNATDLIPSPADAPLIGLGRLCMTIYRGEADYRQGLFMTGQDTLVITGQIMDPNAIPGQENAVRVGAGSRLNVEIGGDAKYIGVESKGLSEQREALSNDRNEAHGRIGRLIPAKGNAESGEALKTRIAAQTASLTDIALVGGKALENMLKLIGKWCGLNEAAVKAIKVTPNLDFGDYELGAKDIVDLMTARTMGAPLSLQSVHNVMKDRGLTQMNFEEELDLVQEENAKLPPPPGTVGGRDPGVDPHLTDEDGNPQNKDMLSQQAEARAESRQIREERRNPPARTASKK
jgi:hypothetical protein